MRKKILVKSLIFCTIVSVSNSTSAQYVNIDKVDASTKLYLAKPAYKTPYGVTSPENVKTLMDRVLIYLEESTPIGVIDKVTKEEFFDYKKINKNSIIKQGTFSITNYMWGVTYASMLSAAKITGDERYKKYVADRLKFLSEVDPLFAKVLPKDNEEADPQMRQLLRPEALDDAGAMCTAVLKAKMDKVGFDGTVMIERYSNFILNKEYRLTDGTFARNRPQKNTIWLDDMFMAVPALANMGKLTGNTKCYDEAIKQITQFSSRMFLPETGLYRHGWIEAMDPHPSFLWGRANGWALLAKVEALDAIPPGYPGRDKVLALLKAHIQGLSKVQSGEGLWHQLLDKNDSYLETSASAIFVYCMAKAINEGWIDALAYGPQTMLGWHGLTTKVNERGEINGICVGTGMGYDPAFYYYRPVNKAAAHGYGPFLFAGAEIYRLLKNKTMKMNDSALMFYKEKVETDAPIFYLEENGVRDHH